VNVLFGVARRPDPAASLLKRFKLPDACVDVVHVLAPTDYLTYGVDLSLTPAEVERVAARQDRDARGIVARATKALGTSVLCRTHVLFGSPASTLLAYADQHRPDLIVVNAAQTRSEARALLAGSVARALVAGAHQSLLIARALPRSSRALRAVFATDHSEYADRCFERFLDMAPEGIGHLSVLSAYPKARLDALQELIPGRGLSVSRAVHDTLCRRNARLCARVQEQEWTTTSHVLPEPVHMAIGHVMDEESADLLILGAKGHSLIERLALGSVAMQQAMAGAYPTLILRAPEPPKAWF
jgi:nucleotide-binding universal stress UspA family protein